MSHSTIDTAELGDALNRYGPTAARSHPKTPARLDSTTVDIHAHVHIQTATDYMKPHVDPMQIAAGNTWLVEGELALMESLGEVSLLYIDVAGQDEPWIAKLPGTLGLERGTMVRLTADPGKMHAFASDGVSLKHL